MANAKSCYAFINLKSFKLLRHTDFKLCQIMTNSIYTTKWRIGITYPTKQDFNEEGDYVDYYKFHRNWLNAKQHLVKYSAAISLFTIARWWWCYWGWRPRSSGVTSDSSGRQLIDVEANCKVFWGRWRNFLT